LGISTQAFGNVQSQALQTAVNTNPRMSKKPCKTIWACKVTTRPNIQSTFATIVNAKPTATPKLMQLKTVPTLKLTIGVMNNKSRKG
jgi:hypothetical protein